MKLMKLEGSSQEVDIRTGKAPSDIFDGVARVKTYVKMQDIFAGASPRELEFDQPYQVASATLGCSWNETNRAVVFQTHGCNLDCPYCFVGGGKGMEQEKYERISSTEMLRIYQRYRSMCERSGVTPARVVRLSGGEPFLQPKSVVGFVTAGWDRKVYLWVDTNLTIDPPDDLVGILAASPRTSVCGCFKPHLGEKDLERQMKIAKRLVEAGVDCFFYWPAALDDPPKPLKESFEDTITAMDRIASKVARNAPLRTTVIRIKYYYDVVSQRNPDANVEGMEQEAIALFRVMREAYLQYLDMHYDPSLVWLPSHMVDLGGGN